MNRRTYRSALIRQNRLLIEIIRKAVKNQIRSIIKEKEVKDDG